MLGSSQNAPLFSAPLLAGDDGTAQTISQLRNLVDDAWKDSFVNNFAIQILKDAGAQPWDGWGQIRAIYCWVKANMYFVNDPVNKEALRPTRDLLQMRAGDCDDINANVLPALLGTVGYETRLVTIASDPSEPRAFTHVYCEVSFDGLWVPLDAARPGAIFGIAPPRFYRRAWWSLIGNQHEDYPGAGQTYSYGPNSPYLNGRRLRGLGDVSSDVAQVLNTALQQTPAIIAASNGQPVFQSANQTVIGPGGLSTVAPGGVAAIPGSSTTTPAIALLIGAGVLLFAMTGKGRR